MSQEKEKGRGETGAIIIIGMIFYFLFMGMLANALGYHAPLIGDFTEVSLPGPLALLTPVVWVVGAMGSMVGLAIFQISGGGGVPIWLDAFAFTPLAFGTMWLVFEMIRG